MNAVALPQLTYEPTSQNQRVKGFEVFGDEQPRIFTIETLPDKGEVEEIIQAAYRQIFHEQQMLASSRQPCLESQLRMGQSTVKEFVRSLLLSPVFRERNYEVNNNYRFVRMCIQRVLGRDVYGDRETMSWSIVLATKGLKGFVDDLLNSEEYLENFGDNTVPYQRRRILPQRAQGDVTFAHMPRYTEDYLTQLKSLGYNFDGGDMSTYWQPPEKLQQLWLGIAFSGGVLLILLFVSVVLSWFGLIQI
ncbi:MAG: phycobilisome rod-core linker polypeptide [Cyanobacteria bacterium P01_F01_bin.86]